MQIPQCSNLIIDADEHSDWKMDAIASTYSIQFFDDDKKKTIFTASLFSIKKAIYFLIEWVSKRNILFVW